MIADALPKLHAPAHCTDGRLSFILRSSIYDAHINHCAWIVLKYRLILFKMRHLAVKHVHGLAMAPFTCVAARKPSRIQSVTVMLVFFRFPSRIEQLLSVATSQVCATHPSICYVIMMTPPGPNVKTMIIPTVPLCTGVTV